MKVVCIDNKFSDKSGVIFNLTYGKVYDVIDTVFNSWYYVIDDYGKLYNFNINRFESLSNYRNEKIDKLLK